MVLPKKLTREELKIYTIIVNKFIAKLNNPVYNVLTNPIDKMIVYYVFDQGFSINDTVKKLGRHRGLIWYRKKIINSQLKGLW